MRFLIFSFGFFLLLLALGAAAVVAFGIEREALIEREVRLSAADVRHVRDLLALHDPRKMRDGQVETVVVGQRDLELAVNYLTGLVGRGGAAIEIGDGSARLRATLHLPRSKLGEYVNIDAELVAGEGLPRLAPFAIGRLQIPESVTDFLLRLALDTWYHTIGSERTSDVVRRVVFEPGVMRLTYRWDARVVAAMRDALMPPADQDRLAAYNALLVERMQSGRGPVALSQLLPTFFALARTRSAAGEPAAENRALITLLAYYVQNGGIERLAPAAAHWPQPERRTVTLLGRRDLAQHFLVSAALAAQVGDAIADAIGVFKEVDDADGGSGFSFRDLCADKAGTAFGARGSAPSSAAALQQLVIELRKDNELMPAVEDLAENMQQATFTQRYGGVGDPRYEAIVSDIADRIRRLPLYR